MRRRAEAALDPNKAWLGEVSPAGIVVAAAALAEHALVPATQTRVDTEAVAALLCSMPPEPRRPALPDAWAFLSGTLGWGAAQVAGSPGGPPVPDALRVVLPASDTVLEPHMAVQAPDGEGWQLLLRVEEPGVEADRRGALPGWEATPHQRFERLLRETGVSTGLLLAHDKRAGDMLRLVHAPPGGETSGWFDVPLRALGTVGGRGMLGGLKLLLSRHRLFGDAPERRLPALLEASRRSQAAVSTKLAQQVLGALHELLRGLHAAAPQQVASLTQRQPEHAYGGLLAVLMRLVFLLYAEDRGLVPSRDDPAARAFYDQGYGVRALHARLLEDEALHPDTMDERRGAWHRLLALFRLVHAGDGTGWMRGRGGKLFDPCAFPFLQGQSSPHDPVQAPPVSDGCVLRVLDGLLVLDGERLSYRALDVEQVGSVYETVMGFEAKLAAGPSLAIKAGKRDRTPVFVDLQALAAVPGKDRLRWLKERTERGKLPPKVDKAVKAAKDAAALAAAFAEVADGRGSPGGQPCPAGAPMLQPTGERRRTGSHYTPRDLTAPVVLHALQPAFERIGPDAAPEAVLALKVCDPAMGSGAFLVEACRQLAARLVEAWRIHPGKRPAIPPDETEDLHARRLVAQKCLYGVDRNPMAADLARLSLWLATLARDHEFTFLDHALRVGDSLVGLSRAQVGQMHWDAAAGLPLFADLVRSRLPGALRHRESIRSAGDDATLDEQGGRWREVEAQTAQLRQAGDAVLGAFFLHGKPAARLREVAGLQSRSGSTELLWADVARLSGTLAMGEHPVRPFHWEIEFPEVFAGDAPGFDAVVGNPPFAGKNTLINGHRESYPDWLKTLHPGAHGNADLVAHFFRRAFALLRPGGCMGLVATNTVSQGDTRESGLRALLGEGGSILRAIRRLPWPGEAAVVVSVVHMLRGASARSPVLDGRQASRISAYLVDGELDASPARLAANAGKSFQGMILLGMGFTFDDKAAAKGAASSLADMDALTTKRPDTAKGLHNAERIFPYLGGQEVNTSPVHAHHRSCIDFNDYPLRRQPMAVPGSAPEREWRWADMDGAQRAQCRKRGIVPMDYPEPVAADWPDLLEIVERLVKPERDPQKRDALRERWWQYAEKRPGLRSAIHDLSDVIVAPRITQHPSFVILKAGRVYNEKTVVFASSAPTLLGSLSARSSEMWIRFFTSTMKDDLNYAPSDCFDNFPLPVSDDSSLYDAAETYHAHRAALMVQRGEGLTKTYNRFHAATERAADIQRLRALHHGLDLAVLRAYGWHDLAAGAAPEFLTADTEPDHRYQERLFWPAPFRDEVLKRLLDLNAQRAEEERLRGLAPPPLDAPDDPDSLDDLDGLDSGNEADELEDA